MSEIKGRVHSIETFGSVDGPGVRFVIFLQGCALRCRYCHNVDTWDLQSSDMRDYTAEELLDKAERYRAYWGKPNAAGESGGITVSGGEPLLQIDFLLDLFQKAKKRGIHTCIDTAGQPFTDHGPWFEKFEALMEVTDLLLVDIKHIDEDEHVKLTGRPNGNILAMLRYLDRIGKPIWIRHVLVPGITDNVPVTDENGVTDPDAYLHRTRAFLDTLSNVKKVEILPYHAMAVFKWEKLGIPYTLRDVEPPSKDRVINAQKILGAAIDE